MFTAMHVRNFKSWKDSGQIRLAPVTVFFGANSSGKTSLLQALLLLKQSAESTDQQEVLHLGGSRSLVSLGLMTDILHNHDRTAELELGLSWHDMSLVHKLNETLPIHLHRQAIFAFNTRIKFGEYRAVGRPDSVVGPHVRELSYMTKGIDVKYHRSSLTSWYELKVRIGDDNSFLKQADVETIPLLVSHPIKYFGFPRLLSLAYQNAEFLYSFEISLQRLLEKLHYLGLLRTPPERDYRWQGSTPSDVGSAGENVVEALLSSDSKLKIARELRRDSIPKQLFPIRQVIADWLVALDLVSKFAVERLTDHADIYQVRIRRSEAAADVLLPDIGFGVSQVLPVLVQLAYVPEGSVVILEQPELHLHPSVQSGLADIILETAEVGRAQVIVESHSEHLLARLQRRIAEGQVSKDDVAVYFCSHEDGSSRIRSLELDDNGRIANWADGFFGDLMGEAAAMVEAGMRRSQSSGL